MMNNSLFSTAPGIPGSQAAAENYVVPIESDLWSITINKSILIGADSFPGLCLVRIPYSGTLVYNYTYGTSCYVAARQLWIHHFDAGQKQFVGLPIYPGISSVPVSAGDMIVLQCYDPVYDCVSFAYNVIPGEVTEPLDQYLKNSWTLLTNPWWFGNLQGTYNVYTPFAGNMLIDYKAGLQNPADYLNVWQACNFLCWTTSKSNSFDYLPSGQSEISMSAPGMFWFQLFNPLTDRVCIDYQYIFENEKP